VLCISIPAWVYVRCKVGRLISCAACAHAAFYSALFAFKESNSCRILLEYVLTELLFRGNCNREKARKRILMLSYFMQS
jgi:hypothetical protein